MFRTDSEIICLNQYAMNKVSMRPFFEKIFFNKKKRICLLAMAADVMYVGGAYHFR